MDAPIRTELPPAMRRLSRRLATICTVLTLVLPVGAAAYWLFADPGTLAVRANLPPAVMAAPPAMAQRLAAAALTEVPLLMLLAGLWQARRCFTLFAAGYVFTADAMQCLRRFAGWAMLSAVADVVCRALVSVLLTLHNAPGHRHVAIGLGSDQLFLLLFALMVWLMAAVLGAGRTLADENASFV